MTRGIAQRWVRIVMSLPASDLKGSPRLGRHRERLPMMRSVAEHATIYRHSPTDRDTISSNL